MTTHPTRTVLTSYRQGTLTPEELLAADDHISLCAECRLFVASSVDSGTALRRFVEAVGGEHLSFEVMERRANGQSTPDEHARASQHLGICRPCANELADLERVARPPAPGKQWRWLAGASAAAAAMTVIGFLAFYDRPDLTAPKAVSTQSMVQPKIASAQEPAARTSIPDPLQSLDPSLRRVADALQAGTLVSADLLASLQRRPEQQRGGAEERAFRVTAPVGVVVESDRPFFRWTRKTAEETVTVQIFDRDYSLVTESERIAGTSWQPPAALPRGATYRWQLSVHEQDGHDTIAPAPPDPPALFHVVGASSFAELERARQSDSTLEAGLICVREGLLDEGSRMLSRFASRHPQSPVAARLAERARAAAQSAPIATNGAQ